MSGCSCCSQRDCSWCTIASREFRNACACELQLELSTGDGSDQELSSIPPRVSQMEALRNRMVFESRSSLGFGVQTAIWLMELDKFTAELKKVCNLSESYNGSFLVLQRVKEMDP